MLKLGIIGSRRRDSPEDFLLVKTKATELIKPYFIDTIVSGGCPLGADRFAPLIAQQLNLKMIVYPANWKLHGRTAGFIRNSDIALWSDILLACVAEDRIGGTEDTIRKFIKLHSPKNLFIV